MKGLFLLLMLVLAGYITMAATITESTFSTAGASDFYINGFDSNGCKDYVFDYTGKIDPKNFHILSLSASFSPNLKSNASIRVEFNGEQIVTLRQKDVQTPLARIYVPDELVQQKNSIKICATTSASVNQIKIGADSIFGVYSGPYFPRDKGLELELETYSPYAGVPFNAQAVARNFGTQDIEVLLTYRKQELEENTPEVSILKGETSKRGIVPSCTKRDSSEKCTSPGEYRIGYSMVANKAVPMTLLPALITYTNVFGEEENLLSNRPSIGAQQLPHKLSVKIALQKDKLSTGENIPIKIKVQNISKERVGRIELSVNSGLEIAQNVQVIDGLEAGQESEALFSAKSLQAGNYALGCVAKYESRELECDTTTLTLQQGLDGRFIGSLVFALIACVVFAYFYLKKN